MKQVIKLTIPLSVLLFSTITKWWYTFPDDAPDTIFEGFPMIYKGPGWHTSLCLQIFIIPLFIDLITYTVITWLIVYLVNRFVIAVKIHKIVSMVLYVTATIWGAVYMLIAANPDNAWYINRPWRVQVLDTGYQFAWQQPDRDSLMKRQATELKKLANPQIQN